MSDYTPQLPNRFSRIRLIYKGLLVFLYSLIFFILGWPNFRIASQRLADGTRYSEYVGLGGFEYLIYQDHQPHPPLFFLRPLIFNSPEFKHDDMSYEIRPSQPE